jgi:hypothetical protein
MLAMGVFGLLDPAGLIRFAERWRDRERLQAAGLLRLTFAAALALAAPGSRAPLVLQGLALITGVSGLVLLLLPHERSLALLSRWLEQTRGFWRGWAAFAAVTGAFLIWVVG